MDVYDPYDFGAATPCSKRTGGTSLASPLWAGMIAIADQGRALDGAAPLTGDTQTLPALYSLPSTDFHQITMGYNGYNAGTGYNMVTGLGSPKANLLIPQLAAYGLAEPGRRDHRADGERRRGGQLRPGRLGPGRQRQHRSRLQWDRDPLAQERAGGRQVHPDHGAGRQRRGGLLRPATDQAGQGLSVPGNDPGAGLAGREGDRDLRDRRDAR